MSSPSPGWIRINLISTELDAVDNAAKCIARLKSILNYSKQTTLQLSCCVEGGSLWGVRDQSWEKENGSIKQQAKTSRKARIVQY
eukprot:scaffold149431_cov36-Cyclotella_meneghiniana.AAC.4